MRLAPLVIVGLLLAAAAAAAEMPTPGVSAAKAAAAAAAGVAGAVPAASASAASARKRVPIKINPGEAAFAPQTAARWTPGVGAQLVVSPPAPATGPPELLRLKDECHARVDGAYRYQVCLFQNVTQRDKAQTRFGLHVALGSFRGWARPGDFSAMVFDEGTPCGSGRKRRAVVNLACAAAAALESIAEPRTCEYELRLALPAACGLAGNGGAAAGATAAQAETTAPAAAAAAAAASASASAASAEATAAVIDDAAVARNVRAAAVADQREALRAEARTAAATRVEAEVEQLRETVTLQEQRMGKMQSCIHALTVLLSKPEDVRSVRLMDCAEFAK
jgi:chromosome segregation protein